MNDEHNALVQGASVLERATQVIGEQGDGTKAALEDVYRYLTNQFLPHARVEEERCARLALRDHHHPEGSCGEPEVETLTVRLDRLRAAFTQEGQTPALAELARTCLEELSKKVHRHIGS